MRVNEQMIFITECENHIPALLYALEESGVRNWVVAEAGQGRISDALVYQPPHSFQSARLVVAAGASERIARCLSLIAQGVTTGELCPGCVAHNVEAERVEFASVDIDPVCGMAVSRESALEVSHEGSEFFFCSEECQTAFRQSPASYVWKAKGRS